jgi:hypothetical protein
MNTSSQFTLSKPIFAIALDRLVTGASFNAAAPHAAYANSSQGADRRASTASPPIASMLPRSTPNLGRS